MREVRSHETLVPSRARAFIVRLWLVSVDHDPRLDCGSSSSLLDPVEEVVLQLVCFYVGLYDLQRFGQRGNTVLC